MSRERLARWHAYVAAPDHGVLWDMLHPDAVFESPVVHTPQRGREIVFKYLASADQVLGGEGFRYVGEWFSDDGAVLEFESEVDGIKVNGVDMIRWDADGRIVHFKVMVRPLKAIQMVHAKMGEMLAKGA
ncbi:nuclear transport factor 2 family protein [Sandaracinobacteroides saxicola]|uniref:Nuclear transport factor 2 family protein n=1 Tax=Sandaracinobacteroides saxicola TaxID=2759707 RepID=A0A7G5IE87_9SPHN|nr:nuclear transport factor 2 family protein [Sandaracinobacteroides saxicola]QMW21679.1 nuclear transport factor 2 family protein [Sandaracinobacteroides saxicola]